MSTYLNPNAFTDLTKTKLVQGDHEIWYKPNNGEIINPSTTFFGTAKIISNKPVLPSKGIWVIEFDSPVYCIPEGAFANSNLLDIWFPDCCTDIESNAFKQTSSLYNVDINCGYSIDIYEGAFGRSAIKHLTLKSDNVTIYSNAFAESSLESITFTSLNPPDVSYEAFNHTENLKIYVPTIAYDAYLQVFNDAGITNVTVTAYATKEDLQNIQHVQHADFATELTGRLEATPELFTYRPSAGDKSIKDDNAFIRRVKGNSVVFNQLVKDNGYSNNGVVTTFNNGVFTLAGTPTSTYFNTSEAIPLVLGHTMLLQVFVVANPKNVKARFGDLNQNAYIPIDTGGGIIYTASGLVNHYLGFYESNLKNIDFTGLQIFQMLVDLTAMFGAGNEPTTVEEFRALYPNSYYPYNPGELRNLVCSGIKTVGFNLVDKNNFLTGVISNSDTPSQTQKSDYRYIKVPVFPNTEYYLKDVSNLYHYYSYILYDSNMNRIKAGGIVVRDDYPYNASFVTTTPSNAAYMIINVHKDFVDTCCVNLHHTGYRDGEYEPYKEVTHALPLSQITNGEPLRKAGSAYDEINETEYIRRVGVVDLGSLAWGSFTDSDNGLATFHANIPTDCVSTYVSTDKANMFCTKYATDTWDNIWAGRVDKAIGISYLYIRLRDTSFTTSAALKASLSGVLLQYELAEPIVKPIETPIDFNYYVEDFGTEEAILAENSAPFNADIIYQFNAVDRIRQNDLNIDRLEGKVLALPSEFKTINGNSIIGSGDLIITAGNVGTEDDDGGLDDVNTQTYLRYVEQSLTDEQKLQARINIGASSNIIIGNATQDTTSLRHNTLLKWTEDGTTESMFLEFPTNDGSTVLNCGFLLYLTPDATSEYSLYLDGIEIYWANNTTPDLEPEYYYEMWFTSYDGGGAWFGVFTKYTM